MSILPEKILLHCCCAPCAVACVERLLAHGRQPGLCFANSNLDSREEYRRRLAAVEQLATHFQLPLFVVPYDHESWLAQTAALAAEPERGRRCPVCFACNLADADRVRAANGYECFTTSLTVSPHKNSAVIFEAAAAFPAYDRWDFKKQDGFKRSLALTELFGFYRQNYCGCEFARNR